MAGAGPGAGPVVGGPPVKESEAVGGVSVGPALGLVWLEGVCAVCSGATRFADLFPFAAILKPFRTRALQRALACNRG